MEGDRNGTGKVQLPGLREDQSDAGPVPCDRPGLGRPKPLGDDPVREVRPASAVEPAGRALCTRRRADQPVDDGRRRRIGLRRARPGAPAGRGPCHGGRTPARRRHDRPGASQRQDRHRPVLGLCARRSAVRRPRPAGGDVLLLPRPQRRAPAAPSGRIRRAVPGRCL